MFKDLAKGIIFKYPGAQFVMHETYDSLDWHDVEVLKPTEEEVEAAWEEYLNHKKNTEYKRLRAAAYPSIEDQLDLIYKEGIEGWRNVIYKTKLQYPNPNDPVVEEPNMSKTAVQAQLEELINKVEKLSNKTDERKLSTEELQVMINDIKAGMSAINGFMMEIPNIQKQLNEINIKLEDIE